MNHQLVAVVGSSPQSASDWCRVVATAGAIPAQMDLGTSSVIGASAWVVVLDQWQAPMSHSFWLRTLPTPIVLVTPHTLAAQELAPLISQLKVISPPGRALHELADMLVIAMAGTAGTLIVPSQGFEVLST
jgi:hypothetical protein